MRITIILFKKYEEEISYFKRYYKRFFIIWAKSPGSMPISIDDFDDSLISGNTIYGDLTKDRNGLWVYNSDNIIIEKK